MFNKHISLKSVPVFSPFLLEIIQTANYLRHFLYDVHYAHPLSLVLYYCMTLLCLVTQSCLTLCSPMGCSPPGSSVHGIFQARILEWVVISFFKGSSQPRGQTQVSCIDRWILYHQHHLGSPVNILKELTLKLQGENNKGKLAVF